MIARITTRPGKRAAMIAILEDSAAAMPGCLSYIVAKDSSNEDVLWVTEAWESQAAHDASLALPAVRDAIPRSKEIVANFERVATTTPVWRAGLKS